MKKIIITTWDKYVVELSDEDYNALLNGDIDASEILEDDSIEKNWKNGAIDWD